MRRRSSRTGLAHGLAERRRAGGVASPRRPGFSLLELLVTVGLIGLLVGLLLPALRAGLEQGRQAACLANLRTTAQGWIDFTEERRFFPERGMFDWGGVDHYVDAPTTFLSPTRPVNPYVGVEMQETSRWQVFRCPSDTGMWEYGKPRPAFQWLRGSSSDEASRTAFGKFGTSYRANEWIWTRVGAIGWIPTGPNRNMTTTNSPALCPQPSLVVLVGDCGPLVAGRYERSSRAPNGVVYGWWHGEERAQLAFLDGSARHVAMTPGTAATSEYSFYLDRSKQPAGSWVYAASAAGTPRPPRP